MLISGNVKDSAFVVAGFSNWKDATVSFASHEKSATHKRAVESVITIPQTTQDKMLASCCHLLTLQKSVVTGSASLPLLKTYAFLLGKGLLFVEMAMKPTLISCSCFVSEQ